MLAIPFIVAWVLGLVIMPQVRRFSVRIGKVAHPRQDRWNQRPTATLGGIGIYLAFCGALSVSLFISGRWSEMHWGLLLGSTLMFILGLVDDFRHISPAAKLVGQILAAVVVIALGYTTRFFSPRMSNEILAQLPNVLLTFFWLVGITNAINLLDNMDGLAGGISLITAGILSYFFWQAGDFSLLVFCLALAGAIFAFMFFNFPPASIFMGDSGSLFLGFTLAALAIAQRPQASNVFAVMAVPTLLFLLPILDTTLVTFTRLLRGQSPVQGGRDHTSHRLVAFGLSERQTLAVLYGVAFVSGIVAAGLESISYWLSLALAPLLMLSLALLAGYLGGLKLLPAASQAPAHNTAITRIMLDLTFKRRLFDVLLDFFLIGISYYLAFLAHYDLVMTSQRLDLFLNSLPLALGSAYISFFLAGVYRGVWRYIGFSDLLQYFWAALGSVILMAAGVFVLGEFGLAAWINDLASIILVFFAVFLLVGLVATRSSFRILDTLFARRARAVDERVLILGAGDAGEMALRWIQMNPQLHYHPVGFLAPDPFMVGRVIHGVEVLGGLDELERMVQHRQVDGVILAGFEMGPSRTEAVLEVCRMHDCWLRRLRLEFEPYLDPQV